MACFGKAICLCSHSWLSFPESFCLPGIRRQICARGKLQWPKDVDFLVCFHDGHHRVSRWAAGFETIQYWRSQLTNLANCDLIWTMTLHNLDHSYVRYFLVGNHCLPEAQRSKQSVADVLTGSSRERETLGECLCTHSESWIHPSCWGGVFSDSLKTVRAHSVSNVHGQKRFNSPSSLDRCL